MRNTKQFSVIGVVILLLVVQGCNIPGSSPTGEPPTELPIAPLASSSPDPLVSSPEIEHVMFPATEVGLGNLVFDVRSDGTAPEKRAPYGDAYDLNRFERPFQQDMTYVSDLDILSYNLNGDADWLYVSIELIGRDPNNPIGIHFGVEIDLDRDGYGDYIIWGTPPYSTEWTTDTVQVYKDDNHDTAGLSAVRSDAPFDGNGYETLVFDRGVGDDADLAWMRVNAGLRAQVQFALKRSLITGPFMFGVVADSGLKDVGGYDYNDRFTEGDAGSPEKNESNYPLKSLFGVDNSCQSAIGFEPSGYEPKLCPVEPTPTPGPRPPSTPGACQPPPDNCAGGWWVPEPSCYCGYLY